MKYLIVGLGNIGEEYRGTRHNIGFEILNALAAETAIPFLNQRYADVATIRYRGRILVCIKPTTYVNLSGKAVKYWLQQENIPVENMLVITDDLALPFGSLRMKGSGGSGGHNGMTNIIELLGTTDFPRLRFGIGDEFKKGSQVDFVLGKWSAEESKTIRERIQLASDIIKSFTTAGIGQTMTAYNNK